MKWAGCDVGALQMCDVGVLQMGGVEKRNFGNAVDLTQWSRNELNQVTFEGGNGVLAYEVEIFRSPLLTVYRGTGHVGGIRHVHPMTDDPALSDRCFVLAYFANGAGEQRIWQGDRSVSLHAGDMTLIDSREAYSIGECEEATEFLYFRLSSHTLTQWMPLVESCALCRISSEHGWGHLLGSYLSQLNPTSLSRLGKDPSLLKIIPEHIASMLRNALSDQQDSPAEAQPSYQNGRSRKMYRQVNTWLRENFANPDITLETVATHFHLSTRQLSRIIQKETDESVPNILIRMRVERAADMLSLRAYDHLTIADVAVAVGMPNAATFHRNFMRIIGATPARFRREQSARKAARSSAQHDVADRNPANVR